MRPFLRCWMLALAASLLAASAAVHAQWKWRDASGRITLSDTPPPASVPDKDILQRPASRPVVPSAPPAPTTSAAVSAAPAAGVSAAEAAVPTPPRPVMADPVLEARRRAAEQERQAKEKAEQQRLAAARADNCRRARGQLAALESGQRMARTNEKGEREVLDDRGRAEEIQRARAVIGSDCAPGS